MPYPNMILDEKKKVYQMNNLQYYSCKTRLEFRLLRVWDSRHSENVSPKNCYLYRSMPLPLSGTTIFRRTLYVVRTKHDRLKMYTGTEYAPRPVVRIVHFPV